MQLLCVETIVYLGLFQGALESIATRFIDFPMVFDVCFRLPRRSNRSLATRCVRVVVESAGVGILGTAHRAVQVQWFL